MSDVSTSPSFLDRVLNGQTLKWVGGVSAAAFIGYALYFDYCRTHAPDYKERIREKRKEQAQATSQGDTVDLPDIRNAAEVQQYFLQQIQVGEELIAQGLIDEGVKHLCNAIILCGQPEQLLAVFQQTMPAEYPKIMQELPRAQARIEHELQNKFGVSMRGATGAGGGGAPMMSGTIVDDDDLE